MKKLKILLIAVSPLFLFSCGIEEYYYLPQVPPVNITSELSSNATIDIPPISQPYATAYYIYYRIYISNYYTAGSITTPSQMSQINSALASNFNALDQYTNPANTTTITNERIFKNLGYYELSFSPNYTIPVTGGEMTISFSGTVDNPTALINGSPYELKRSNQLIGPHPNNDFSYSDELNNSAYSSNNADIARNTVGGSAYVSMYIVAVGVNPENFTRIYSKPTHINIFRLPGN